MADKRTSYYAESDYTGSSNTSCSMARVQPAIGTIVHSTGGTNSRAVLQGLGGNIGDCVSAHALINKDGTRDILYASDRVCFHAGATWWPGIRRRNVDTANEVFLGVELEQLSDEAATYQQIDSLAELIVFWALDNGWRFPYLIYGHSALAAPLGRKSDPYRFDCGMFFGRLLFHSRLWAIAGL